MKIAFSKYHGAGNDFVIIDEKDLPNVDLSHLAKVLCHRQHGIGADGLILLGASTAADYKMRIFNADGSEPAMCGNGIRCLFDFIQKRGPLRIETLSGILACRQNGTQVAVNLGTPKILHWPLKLPGSEAFVVDTGVPHAVLFVDDLDAVDVAEAAPKLRFSPHFAPHGVNVNFVSLLGNGGIALRSYERGVEAETLACGTGAAAAAFVAVKLLGLTSPITTMTKLSFQHPVQYRQNLHFHVHQNEIEMLGPAVKVFEGIVALEMAPMVGDNPV